MDLKNEDNSNSADNNPKHYAQQPTNSSGIKYLLYPGIMLALLWYGANTLLQDKQSQLKNPPPASVELMPCGMILHADRNGHFRGTLQINGVEMPFMIDTGATQTTIPARLATAAGLPFGKNVAMETAGGLVIAQQTRIDNLKLGNAEIKNLDANINQHLNEVLIGMNTLKYFRMIQNADTLTLLSAGIAETDF